VKKIKKEEKISNMTKNPPKKVDFIYKLINYLLFKKITRKLLIRLIEKIASNNLKKPSKNNKFYSQNKRIRRERRLMVFSIIQSVNRSISNGFLDKKVAATVLKLWGDALTKPFNKNTNVQKFEKTNGCKPPFLLVLSPGHSCNLNCRDCYASSGPGGASLPWDVLDRIVSDARRLWDIKLVVFSGGEPFMYKSKGKDILDIASKHQDCLFLAFTNGTIFNSELAGKVARCKNLTPAFSVEGMEKETDLRRGRGVFQKVIAAMGLMRGKGVPFGISVTVNKENYLKVLEDDFLDFFFTKQGVFYSFYFQYLPIGRNANFDAMPDPMQRKIFWEKIWRVIEDEKLFLLDFWNHGPLVNGCIAAGREGGYIYIDWDGNIYPCVFAPYAAGNIHDLYSKNLTLNDFWKNPFFKEIRNWQYGYGYGKKTASPNGNLLRPCPYRDHHGLFMEWVERYGLSQEKVSNTKDYSYHRKMISYGKKLAEVFDPVWEKEYLQ